MQKNHHKLYCLSHLHVSLLILCTWENVLRKLCSFFDWRKGHDRISRVPFSSASGSTTIRILWVGEKGEGILRIPSCPKWTIHSFQQTLLVVLKGNELIGPILYSEFHRIKVLGTPKTSDKHGSKATLVSLLYHFISGLLSLSLGFVLLCFLQGSFSTYKLVRA